MADSSSRTAGVIAAVCGLLLAAGTSFGLVSTIGGDPDESSTSDQVREDVINYGTNRSE